MASDDALLLCDSASRDAQTGKWTLVGVFDAVWAPEFPAVHQALDAYFRLRLAAPADIQLVLRAPGDTESLLATVQAYPTPRGLVEGAVRLMGLQLGHQGDYRFELRAGGQALGATTLTVAQLPAPSAPRH